jgi:hypothetical protein
LRQRFTKLISGLAFFPLAARREGLPKGSSSLIILLLPLLSGFFLVLVHLFATDWFSSTDLVLSKSSSTRPSLAPSTCLASLHFLKRGKLMKRGTHNPHYPGLLKLRSLTTGLPTLLILYLLLHLLPCQRERHWLTILISNDHLQLFFSDTIFIDES